MRSKYERIVVALASLCLQACTESEPSEEACVPQCDMRQCGDDGCGGQCGQCIDDLNCYNGLCMCIPQCDGRTCGDNGCGGQCGTCGSDEVCNAGGHCETVCVPKCDGRTCGDDGCGGQCGACAEGRKCDDGTCVIDPLTCKPKCDGRQCGDDDCGGSCGSCGDLRCSDEFICAPWVLTGKLLYEQEQVDFLSGTTDGYGVYKKPFLSKKKVVAASDMPIALYDGDKKVGEVVTGEDGSFTFAISRAPKATDTLHVSTTWSVKDQLKMAVMSGTDGVVWSWKAVVGDYASPDPSKLKDITVTVNEGSGAINIYRVIRNAYMQLSKIGYAKPVEKMLSLAVLWKPDVAWECGSCFMVMQSQSVNTLEGKKTLTTTMEIDGVVGDGSAWEEPTILHEFGHYVLAHELDSTPGGKHTISSAVDPNVAWSEGWGHFYSLVAQSFAQSRFVSEYWRIMDGTPNGVTFWLDFARAGAPNRGVWKTTEDDSKYGVSFVQQPGMDSGMRQNISEAWVTWAMLMMWADSDFKHVSALDPYEVAPFNVSMADIWRVLASNRYRLTDKFNYYNDGKAGNRTEVGTDLVDFIDGLMCENIISASEFMAWWKDNTSFPYDGDPVCVQK